MEHDGWLRQSGQGAGSLFPVGRRPGAVHVDAHRKRWSWRRRVRRSHRDVRARPERACDRYCTTGGRGSRHAERAVPVGVGCLRPGRDSGDRRALHVGRRERAAYFGVHQLAGEREGVHVEPARTTHRAGTDPRSGHRYHWLERRQRHRHILDPSCRGIRRTAGRVGLDRRRPRCRARIRELRRRHVYRPRERRGYLEHG
jgi:hypothetical protein